MIIFEFLRIPKERIPIFIGKNGKIKKEIEKLTKTKIEIEDEEIKIQGETEFVYKTVNIIKAIGRGFNPEIALELLDDEYQLIIINMGGETKKTMKRLFGRVIGRKGSTKNIIEDVTGAHVSVYGKTVSIIGEANSAFKAKEAVEQLLSGRTHAYVYKRLTK